MAFSAPACGLQRRTEIICRFQPPVMQWRECRSVVPKQIGPRSSPLAHPSPLGPHRDYIGVEYSLLRGDNSKVEDVCWDPQLPRSWEGREREGEGGWSRATGFCRKFTRRPSCWSQHRTTLAMAQPTPHSASKPTVCCRAPFLLDLLDAVPATKQRGEERAGAIEDSQINMRMHEAHILTPSCDFPAWHLGRPSRKHLYT